MVSFNPIRGVTVANTPPVSPTSPTGSGLTRVVVIDRDRQRKQRNQQQQSETPRDEQSPQSEAQQHEHAGYPAYNPHAGLNSDGEIKSPLDVVA